MLRKPEYSTPHIDEIAKCSVRFDSCFVTNPVCMPNRASLMTGRMPSAHGVRSNGIPLNLRHRTFVESLRDSGYRTALVGKAHFQPMSDIPPTRSIPVDHLGNVFEAEHNNFHSNEYECESSSNWRSDPHHDMALPYYGFETVHLCTDHGDEAGGEYGRWLASQHSNPDSLRGPENVIPDSRIITRQSWRTRMPEELYPSSYVGRKAVEFIEKQKGSTQRFFLQVSFPDPHHPFTPPGRYWDMYDPASLPAPSSFEKGDSTMLRHMRNELRRDGSFRFQKDIFRTFAVTEREARETIALTYGMISMIDDQVGLIMSALKKAGLDSNTVVIFMSDHGDYMGDHGIMLKGPLHYRGLIRTPLLWRDPALTSFSTVNSLVSTIDISASILDRANVSPYYGFQGRSFITQLLNQVAATRPSVLVEDDRERVFLGFDQTQRIRTIVTERFRFTMFRPSGVMELFDLQEDPDENDNLAHDKSRERVMNELKGEMLDHLIARDDPTPLPIRLG